jgi:hypothetical protein
MFVDGGYQRVEAIKLGEFLVVELYVARVLECEQQFHMLE